MAPASPSPERALARPPRDTRLDIVRGWLQVSIFLSHSGTALAWAIHAQWGISDASEQFVLLSGVTLGSVFALKSARAGWRIAARDMLARTARLWRTHLLVMLGMGIMVLWAAMAFPPLQGEVVRLGWAWLVEEPWFALPAGAAMLWQPANMGILPVFVVCMLMLPGFLWLAGRWGAWALLAPFGLYALVRMTGFGLPGLGPQGFVQGGIAFDPLLWQVLYLAGGFWGWHALRSGRPLPRHRLLVWGAVLILAFGLWYRLVDNGFIAGPVLPDEPIFGKARLALPRLMHAFALAYLVAVLVPRDAGWMHSWPARQMAAMGRHSLQVFCLGLFTSWAVESVRRVAPGTSWWVMPLLALGGVVLLWLLARGLDWRMAQGRLIQERR